MEESNKLYSKVINLSDEINYSSNSIVSKRILEKRNGNISLFAFDKGQALSEHIAPYEAIIQILDGKAEIIIGKIQYTLIKGETIIMPANIPHSVKATEKFKMLLLMIKDSNS